MALSGEAETALVAASCLPAPAATSRIANGQFCSAQRSACARPLVGGGCQAWRDGCLPLPGHVVSGGAPIGIPAALCL
jgi:hypothetical protein